jgi:hypothetical protein
MKTFEGTWEEIRQHELELRGRRLRVEILPIDEGQTTASEDDLARSWTARELMQLTSERRSKILRHQAANAVEYYTIDPEVREWEKLGVGDMYDEAP